MAPSPFPLPDDLSAPVALLRARAFRNLVAALWRENPDAPGNGVVGQNALNTLPALLDAMPAADAKLVDRLAWLLGLLAEAGDPNGGNACMALMRGHVGVFLDAAERSFNAAAGRDAPPVWDGLLFLLGHFQEEASTVMQRLAAVAGRDALAVQLLGAVFDNAQQRPERSRFLLSYLGAQASNNALDAGWQTCERALACPCCRGELDFHPLHIACRVCGQVYGWKGDIPDLVQPDCNDPEQYTEAIVGLYEAHSRPRFVRVMAGDWHGAVTPEREAAYLARHLHPVDGPVVDLACGAGGWTRMVAQQVGANNVIALDYSTAMLNACQQAVPGIALVRASASALPLADASLGGLNCSDALQALPDPALAFAEASRCLRPGAPMTVFTFREAQAPYAYFQHRLPTHARVLFSDAQIRDLAVSTGFDVVDLGGPGQALFFTLRKRA